MKDLTFGDDLRERNLQTRIQALRDEIAKAETLLASLEGMSVDHVTQKIIRKYAAKAGVTPTELKGLSRKRKIAHARQEAFRELRRDTPLTLDQIGEIFSLRDHSTVAYGINALEEREKAAKKRKAI